MRRSGSRIAGSAMRGSLAAVLIAMLVPTAASAGPIAEHAAEAEAKLAAGDAAGAAAALDAAYDAFAAVAPFALKTAAFASRIDGYGLYTPRTEGPFHAGETVTIYAEPIGVAGAALAPTIEIRDARGLIYAKATDLPPIAAPAGAASRLFHVALAFTLPTLRPGDYQLVLTLAESGAPERTVTATLPMTVAP